MKKEAWGLGLIKVILVTAVHFCLSLGLVALGWNWLLPKIFVLVPVFGLKRLCILTLAIVFISTPATIAGSYTRSRILKAVRGEE